MRKELALVAVSSWSIGMFLYAAVGILVTLRLMLYPFGPEELTPPYWVSMGALAISILAGARIVEMADAPMILVTRHLIAGLAVVFWAFATWLIPVLIAAGWWRHVARRGSASLRTDAVEHDLPLGHVRRGEHLPRPGGPAAARRGGGSLLAVGGSRGLGDGVRGDGRQRHPLSDRSMNPRAVSVRRRGRLGQQDTNDGHPDPAQHAVTCGTGSGSMPQASTPDIHS
jgi:hypothetical protein